MGVQFGGADVLGTGRNADGPAQRSAGRTRRRPGTVGVTWWTRPRLLDAGHAVVVVEGREIGLGTENVAGFGIEGRLGFVDGAGAGQVVVWPGSTVVQGEGESVTISSNGETFRLGDRIDVGSAGRRFPDLRDRLPDECANAALAAVIPGH